MRVAWDLQAITGPRPTGLGYSVQLLLDAYRQHGGADGEPAEVIELRPNAADKALRGVPDRLSWEQWRLPQAVSDLDPPPSLLYSPALGAPQDCNVPQAAHVADLIPLIDPAQFRGLARWYWSRQLPANWRGCDALTVSNPSMRDEVVQRLGYPAAQVHIVPHYALISADEIAAAHDAPRPVPVPYFIMLGSHEPRKNHALALNALALLAERKLRPRLVCLGGHTIYTRLLRQLAQKLGVGDQVTWPGYASRETALLLLRHAAGLLFVSRHEGYGMPPQEAQVLGTPVVLSDIACHRAVYDDAARWAAAGVEAPTHPAFVATEDDAGLAELMQRMLDDTAWCAALSADGLAYQRTFSAQATGQALRAAFSSVGKD